MNLWQDEKALSDAAVLLKTMADPNRLRVLALLMEGDSCNCELREKLGLSSNLLSHHLGVLKNAGLVDSRRDEIDGRWIYYNVDREMIGQWRTWLHQFLNPENVAERKVLCGPEGKLVDQGLIPMTFDGEAVNVKRSGG